MNRMHAIVHAAALRLPSVGIALDPALRSPIERTARDAGRARLRHTAGSPQRRVRIV